MSWFQNVKNSIWKKTFWRFEWDLDLIICHMPFWSEVSQWKILLLERFTDYKLYYTGLQANNRFILDHFNWVSHGWSIRMCCMDVKSTACWKDKVETATKALSSCGFGSSSMWGNQFLFLFLSLYRGGWG